MTILLSGNSVTPAQLSAGTKVAKAEPGMQNTVDTYTGEQSGAGESEKYTVFTLAPYSGKLTEDNESTDLLSADMLSQDVSELSTINDMHNMLHSEVATELMVSSSLTELANISTNLKFDFAASGNSVSPPAEPSLLSQDELAVSPTVSSELDVALINKLIIDDGKLMDGETAIIASELVVANSGDTVVAVDTVNLPTDRTTQLAAMLLLNQSQSENTTLTASVTNSGQLAMVAPVLASLPSAAVTMPVLTAEPDDLIKGNMLSAIQIQPLKQHLGFADNLSLQQFLYQQSVAIAPASSSQFNATLQSPSPLTASLPQWQSMNLSGTPSNWGQQLLAVLSDKVVLQMGQQVQRAQIRLDPPQLGNIELRIAVEGEKTTIQLFATNSQVREAMQQTLELLRLNLGQQLGASNMVDVQLGDQAQQQRAFFADEVAVSQQAELVTTEQQLDSTQQQQQLGWLNRLA